MVRKIVDKSYKQNVKQEVNVRVHIGDKRKKAKGVRRKVGNSGGGGGSSSMPYVPSFNPVYIQSGHPPHIPETNPLLGAIEDIKNDIKRMHVEERKNPLLESVIEKPKSVESTPIQSFYDNLLFRRTNTNPNRPSSVTSTPVHPVRPVHPVHPVRSASTTPASPTSPLVLGSPVQASVVSPSRIRTSQAPSGHENLPVRRPTRTTEAEKELNRAKYARQQLEKFGKVVKPRK